VCLIEKLDWNCDYGGKTNGAGDEDDEDFMGEEGDEEIGISHLKDKGRGLQSSSDDQDYDGEDESDKSET
jgi:hypothetical protein